MHNFPAPSGAWWHIYMLPHLAHLAESPSDSSIPGLCRAFRLGVLPRVACTVAFGGAKIDELVVSGRGIQAYAHSYNCPPGNWPCVMAAVWQWEPRTMTNVPAVTGRATQGDGTWRYRVLHKTAELRAARSRQSSVFVGRNAPSDRHIALATLTVHHKGGPLLIWGGKPRKTSLLKPS